MQISTSAIENTMIFNGEAAPLKIQGSQQIEIGYYGTEKVVFYENGTIKIIGDHNKSLEHLVKLCWDLFNSDIPLERKTIIFFDYLLIDLDNKSIKYLKPNVPEEYFKIEKVIKDQVLRKIKMKAFL